MKKIIIHIALILLPVLVFAQDENASDSLRVENDSLETNEVFDGLTEAEREKVRMQNDLAFQGAMDEFIVQENKDTLVITRTYGDWWFGFQFGLNGSLMGGNLRNLTNPEDVNNPSNSVIPYSVIGQRAGWAGFNVDWQPIYKPWGIQARIFYDPNYLTASSDPSNDELKEFNEINSQINYWGLSLAYSRNLPFIVNGLRGFLGGELYISGSDQSTVTNTKYDTGEVQVDYRNLDLEERTVYGLNLGVEYNIVVSDIARKLRVNMVPFAMVHVNSTMVGDYNTELMNYKARVGVSFKFGPDREQRKILKYDPRNETGFLLVSLEKKEELEFDGFYAQEERLESEDITYYEIEKVEEQVNEEPTFSTELADNSGVGSELEEVEIESLEINRTGKIETFSYSKNTSVRLTEDQKKYLDRLVEWMKKNPNSEINIIGHSDISLRTTAQQDQIARFRMNNVKKYLESKGINGRRIYGDSKGARESIGDPYTREGQRQSRRVDIVVRKIN